MFNTQPGTAFRIRLKTQSVLELWQRSILLPLCLRQSSSQLKIHYSPSTIFEISAVAAFASFEASNQEHSVRRLDLSDHSLYITMLNDRITRHRFDHNHNVKNLLRIIPLLLNAVHYSRNWPRITEWTSITRNLRETNQCFTFIASIFHLSEQVFRNLSGNTFNQTRCWTHRCELLHAEGNIK